MIHRNMFNHRRCISCLAHDNTTYNTDHTNKKMILPHKHANIKHFHSLVGGLGVGPSVEVVHVVVFDSLSTREDLLTVHAQSLVV